jgi:hypothetical protein
VTPFTWKSSFGGYTSIEINTYSRGSTPSNVIIRRLTPPLRSLMALRSSPLFLPQLLRADIVPMKSSFKLSGRRWGSRLGSPGSGRCSRRRAQVRQGFLVAGQRRRMAWTSIRFSSSRLLPRRVRLAGRILHADDRIVDRHMAGALRGLLARGGGVDRYRHEGSRLCRC